MIVLWNHKGMFDGLLTDDSDIHLINIFRIFSSYTIPGVDYEALKLKFFPFSLTSKVTLWLGELARASITTWNDLYK